MSRSPLVAAAFVTSVLAGPGLAHAAPGAPSVTPDGVRAHVEPPAATERARLVLAGDLGLGALGAQLGARYRFLEIDLGLRERSETTETFGGAKLLLHADGPIVPYAYLQVGRWSTTTVLDAFGADEVEHDGLLLAGGFGVEAPLGESVALFLHLGVEREAGAPSRPNQVDAGIGLALRL